MLKHIDQIGLQRFQFYNHAFDIPDLRQHFSKPIIEVGRLSEDSNQSSEAFSLLFKLLLSASPRLHATLDLEDVDSFRFESLGNNGL
ncbi:protein of unknown function [Burkholderia multivorans]